MIQPARGAGGIFVHNVTFMRRRAESLLLADGVSRRVVVANVAHREDSTGRLPIVHFVAPKVFVAASSRVMNLTPVLSRPQLLWTPDTIAVNTGMTR
jgi:hypothetical protein